MTSVNLVLAGCASESLISAAPFPGFNTEFNGHRLKRQRVAGSIWLAKGAFASGGVAGDNHLGTHRQCQGKKFIVFRVAALTHWLGHFNHPQVAEQPIDKRLPHFRAA
jgi:hypothetical protein